jgi:hypothetical protein
MAIKRCFFRRGTGGTGKDAEIQPRAVAGAGNSPDVCGALAQAWFAPPLPFDEAGVALNPELMAELDAIKREHIGGLMSSRPRE